MSAAKPVPWWLTRGKRQPRLSANLCCVASPDPPEVQRSFAEGRGWRMPMVSHQPSSFAADMGYRSEKGGWLPGISVFRRDGRRVLRVADTPLHPGDDYCSLWHMFDMLPGGAGDWEPQFKY